MEITFDPSTQEVLGVFGDTVHTMGTLDNEDGELEDCILVIPREEYINVWNNWLDGKKDYCERYNHYCGVMGYTFVTDIKELETQKLNIWSQSDENYRSVDHRVFQVSKFGRHHDFEHG